MKMKAPLGGVLYCPHCVGQYPLRFVDLSSTAGPEFILYCETCQRQFTVPTVEVEELTTPIVLPPGRLHDGNLPLDKRLEDIDARHRHEDDVARAGDE